MFSGSVTRINKTITPLCDVANSPLTSTASTSIAPPKILAAYSTVILRSGTSYLAY